MTELRPNRRKHEAPFYLSNEGKQYFSPNHAQMIAAVKGHDPRHRIRLKRTPFQLARYAVLVFALLIAAFGVVVLIAEVIVK